MQIIWTDKAWDEYTHWEFHNENTVQKINNLINEIISDIFDDRVSKQVKFIDESNDLVYTANEKGIMIFSCKGHYEE